MTTISQSGVTRMLSRLEKVSGEKDVNQRSISDGIKPDSAISPSSSAQAQFLEGRIKAYKHAGLNCVESQSFCQQVVTSITTGIAVLQELLGLSVGENNDARSADIKILTDQTFQGTLASFDALMSGVAWNGKNVFSGTFQPQFQIGIAAPDIVSIACPDLSLATLGLSGIDIRSSTNASQANHKIQGALEVLNKEFTKFCSLETVIKNKLVTNSTDLQLAGTVLSTQQDTDIPEALMELTQKDAQEEIIHSLLTAFIEQLQKDAKMFENLRNV